MAAIETGNAVNAIISTERNDVLSSAVYSTGRYESYDKINIKGNIEVPNTLTEPKIEYDVKNNAASQMGIS